MTTTTSESIVVNGERVAEALKEVCNCLPPNGGELLLDFFLAQTLNPGAIEAFERLAEMAEVQKVKVVLRGVNVEMYKVLKLSDLTDRFVFIN